MIYIYQCKKCSKHTELSLPSAKVHEPGPHEGCGGALEYRPAGATIVRPSFRMSGILQNGQKIPGNFDTKGGYRSGKGKKWRP